MVQDLVLFLPFLVCAFVIGLSAGVAANRRKEAALAFLLLNSIVMFCGFGGFPVPLFLILVVTNLIGLRVSAKVFRRLYPKLPTLEEETEQRKDWDDAIKKGLM